MVVRVRDDDRRPDGLLEESGRVAARLGLAVAWTSGIRGEKAKQAADKGSGAWKRAAPLSDAEQAARLFRERGRTRNPVCAARASGLVLVEVDGEEALLERFGIRLPETATAKSRRGLHRYYRPAAGCAPAKIQIDGGGISLWEDGYLVLPAGLHPSGWVYEWLQQASINELPIEGYRLLLTRAGESKAQVRELVERGGILREGQRRDFIFSQALELAHEGLREPEITAAMLALGRERCEPPLPGRLVEEQVRGAIKRALQRPRSDEPLRREAEQALQQLAAGGEQAGIPTAARRAERPGVQAGSAGRLRLVQASSVRARARRELIAGLLPLGTITTLAGLGGLGKSSLGCQWIAALTRGELLAQGDAIIVSFEDAWPEVIRPRLEAAGARLDHVHFLEGGAGEQLVLPRDIAELEQLTVSVGATLVVIDPISASIDLKLNAHQERDVRVVLGQLAAMAERTQSAVVAVAHLNKAPSSDVYLRVNGSAAFYNAARSVVTLTRDPEEPDSQRLVAQHKANYSRLAPVQRHRIEEIVLAATDPESGLPISTSRLVYLEDAADVDPFRVLEAQEPRPQSKREQAASFLLAALADGGWHERQGLLALAQGRDISRKTLDRAAEELPLERESGGYPAHARWRLAVGPTTLPDDLTQPNTPA